MASALEALGYGRGRRLGNKRPDQPLKLALVARRLVLPKVAVAAG